MILIFPNSETLQLAITSATLPESVLRAAANMGVQDEAIHVETKETVSRTAQQNLKALGVATARKSRVKLASKLSCWHQLVQPAADHDPELFTDKTTVLFVMQQREQLVDLVSEMMRLGNDRQSFRYLEEKPNKSAVLLRVVGPPYYSLLRALEPRTIESPNGNVSTNGNVSANGTGATNGTANSKNGKAETSNNSPVAFVEKASRVWVQFGFEHPLMEQIHAPVGQYVFIHSDGSWEFINEGPFQDVYAALETRLPENPSLLVDQPLEEKIQMTMRLANAASTELAELWVIRENAIQQIEALISSSDEKLIDRLAFAITGTGDDTTVIIRVRPSKLAPPVVVLDALAFRRYLKLPNLFLPLGMRLHPPLRRDAVSELLAQEKELITWLYPDGDTFQTQRIPDTAFQRLSNWVEYIMDREAESLEAWSNAFQFEFESFVCKDDQSGPPKPKRDRPKRTKKPKKDIDQTNETNEDRADYTATDDAPDSMVSLATASEPLQKIKPNELQVRLEELETEFMGLDEPVDGAGRKALYQQMAPLNAAMERRHDATVCWSNAVWDEPADGACEQWLASEVTASRAVEKVTPAAIKKIIRDQSTRPTECSLVAAYLAWAAEQDQTPALVRENLSDFSQFLERQEHHLPVRTAWIACHALYRLSDGDVLGLARARDRILERLFQTGLTPEFDMPGFLRTAGAGSENRLNIFSENIIELGESVEQWIVEPPMVLSTAASKEYAKLYFAFALARLGDSAKARLTMESACNEIGEKDDAIHNWFALAYAERINAVINAESAQGQLSSDLLEKLEGLERMDKYKVDRLRQQSRILEPLERVDPFLRWHKRFSDPLAERLTALVEIMDRMELQTEINSLLKAHPSGSPEHGRVISAAIQIAPRTGEEFADSLIDTVLATLVQTKDAVDKAFLMQKTMFAAAHFGRIDAVHQLVSEFEKALPKIVESYLEIQVQHNPTNKEKVDTIELLFNESFQGMRKLGMRDEIGRIYGTISELVQSKNPKAIKKRTAKNAKVEIDPTRPWRLLLCVAGGWFYFGQHGTALEIADTVRGILFKSNLEPIEQKSLMCAYIKAMAMAPPELAKERIGELFQLNDDGKPKVSKVKDNMTTATHYSISQLLVAETTVLALVDEEYSLNAESRRWLDEDEFLVRSRIHRDVQLATQ